MGGKLEGPFVPVASGSRLFSPWRRGFLGMKKAESKQGTDGAPGSRKKPDQPLNPVLSITWTTEGSSPAPEQV